MNKRAIEEMEDKIQEQKRIPKEVSQEIMKKLFINLLKAIGIMIYFVILNLAYVNVETKILAQCVESFAGIFSLSILLPNSLRDFSKRFKRCWELDLP